MIYQSNKERKKERKKENNKYRIFYITSEYINIETNHPYDGGLAQYLCKITTSLSSMGHDINVMVTDSPYYKVTKYKNVNVHFIPNKLKKSLLMNLLWLFLPKAKRKKYKKEAVYSSIHHFIKQQNAINKIDLIQYASYLGLGKYPEKDIPSCVRISSYAKLWQKYYNYNNPIEIDNEVQQFQNAKFLYGPSQYIADYIKNDLSLDKQIKIIETPFIPYQGEENQELYIKLISEIKNKPYLLFFGTIGLLKGAQEIADSVFEILNKYKDLHIVLVGKEALINGTSPISIIKTKAQEHQNKVIHFNKTTHDKLFPLIRGAKAVLLPSRIDNLPNTCIEAMGLKKIVIGSKGASFEQLIDDGVSGLLCEANNSQSIIKAVDRLMNLSDTEIQQIENAAYKRSQTLSLEYIVPNVIAYYENVIKNWRK